MTPADEIEKEAQELFDLHYGQIYQWQNIADGPKRQWLQFAAHVIRERKKAVIEARINEQMVYGGSKRHERIPDLTSQLAELERGEK